MHAKLTYLSGRLAMMCHLSLLACCAVLSWPVHAAQVEAVDLDALAAAVRPSGTTVTIHTPRAISAWARVKTLPARGKTQYLQDTLQLQKVARAAPANHKMMLFSPGGEALMAYVEDPVAAQMRAALKSGDRFRFSGLHLWTSRHGPGLLITAFHPEGLAR